MRDGAGVNVNARFAAPGSVHNPPGITHTGPYSNWKQLFIAGRTRDAPFLIKIYKRKPVFLGIVPIGPAIL
jgi:hypothetical protein